MTLIALSKDEAPSCSDFQNESRSNYSNKSVKSLFLENGLDECLSAQLTTEFSPTSTPNSKILARSVSRIVLVF